MSANPSCRDCAWEDRSEIIRWGKEWRCADSNACFKRRARLLASVECYRCHTIGAAVFFAVPPVDANNWRPGEWQCKDEEGCRVRAQTWSARNGRAGSAAPDASDLYG